MHSKYQSGTKDMDGSETQAYGKWNPSVSTYLVKPFQRLATEVQKLQN